MNKMKFVRTPIQKAEIVKRYLIDNDLFDKDHRFLKDEDFVYFPITKEGSVDEKFDFIAVVDKESEKIDKIRPLKEILKEQLTDEEFEILKTAYDAVGTIAILEIPEQLGPKEKIIAEALLESHKNILTVVKKAGTHEGQFRTQKMQHLAGEPTKETVHKENGIQLKLNVETVYFSARLSTERKRICGLIKPGEMILVMFSGCAPYPCVISKNTEAVHITGIEINPEGHRYGEYNIKLNKIDDVSLYQGDVREVVPTLKDKFDRILMPLPHTAEEFLDTAFKVSKPGTIIHLYDFLDEEDIPDKAIEKIDKACKKHNKKYRLLEVVKCGQFAPKTFRICADFVLEN